jgi:N-methylhydantoinase B
MKQKTRTARKATKRETRIGARMLVDPISVEIVGNGLRSIADETFIALMKSAYSTNIKERKDHSTALCDPSGRLIAQAEASLPIHIASMTGLMRYLLEQFNDNIFEGDIFIANDPHVAGGTHLPDINMAMPVFHKGRLVAFMCNIAHHADVGGMAPGSMAGGMTEIYQEGLRLPVIKLFAKNRLRQDLLDLILLNVRVPNERRGDYFAQVAACRLGTRRLNELFSIHGDVVMKTIFREIIERTKQRMQSSIERIPDGTYFFKDVMDDDGLGTRNIPMQVKIQVKGKSIKLDFTGTAKQVKGNINTTLNATRAAVCYTLKALLDPDIPNNQGMLDVAEIVVEKGALVSSVFPAPVAARANTCQRIVDLIIGALAPALPTDVVGAANGANTTAVFSGIDPRTNEAYVYLETLGGGFGGRASKDGTDGVQVHITNTSNLPIESIEVEYPLVVEGYSLVQDSGGAGKYRGGMGLRRVIRPVGHECLFNGALERATNRPWGVFGGDAGAVGRFVLGSSTGQRALVAKPSGVVVSPDEWLIIDSPGAGGYGPAAERSVEAIERDRISGKFSDTFIQNHYAHAKAGKH